MGAMGWTNTTLELKSAFSFMLSMKKSTKAVSYTHLQLLAVFHDLRYELYVDPDARKMNKTVASIMQYISTHYAENMPLEQIAEEVELSPNYICSLFKKETGINLYQYIICLLYTSRCV